MDPRRLFMRIIATGILAGAAAACAGHGVVHVAPDESQPHITWEIRAGGETGDANFVCGSAQPSRACTLPASTPERVSLATVQVYLHAARVETNYLGQVRVPFIAGADQLLRDREISVTVPPDSRPVGSAITGRVTGVAGSYTYAIELDAIQPGAAVPLRIVEHVPVLVTGD